MTTFLLILTCGLLGVVWAQHKSYRLDTIIIRTLHTKLKHKESYSVVDAACTCGKKINLKLRS